MPIVTVYYLLISAAFALLLIFAGWMIRKYSNISILEKVAFMTVVLLFSIFNPFFVFSILGQPTTVDFKKLPRALHLIAIDNNYQNRIFIWLNTKEQPIPLNYEVTNVTSQDRKLLQEAEKMLRQGKQVYLKANEGDPPEGDGDGNNAGKSKKTGKKDDSIGTDSAEDSKSHFHIDHKRVFPPKQDTD
jgi:hypothetical protein